MQLPGAAVQATGEALQVLQAATAAATAAEAVQGAVQGAIPLQAAAHTAEARLQAHRAAATAEVLPAHLAAGVRLPAAVAEAHPQVAEAAVAGRNTDIGIT